MVKLTQRDQIQILIVVGFTEHLILQQEVCTLFNNFHQDRDPIIHTMVVKPVLSYSQTISVCAKLSYTHNVTTVPVIYTEYTVYSIKTIFITCPKHLFANSLCV